MKKILSLNQIQKSLLLLQYLNLNPHLPISLDHKQTHLKAVHKHSRIKQVDHIRDPDPGQLIRKKKMEKKKDKEPNPYSKGASADPIKLVNRFDSLENMEIEIDSSMVSQSRRKQKDQVPYFKSSRHSSWIKNQYFSGTVEDSKQIITKFYFLRLSFVSRKHFLKNYRQF